jgi:hypothetical protein
VILVLLTSLFLAAWLWREHTFQMERGSWTRERGLLLNRIKPETAQHVDVPDDGPGPQPPAWDDSAEWWAEDEVT